MKNANSKKNQNNNNDLEKIDDKSVKFIDEPIKHRETCFCIEELYSIFINISKNKDKLFKDEETKTLSKIFDKIDKKSNMKIIEDIMHEKIYENIDEDKTEHKKNDKKIKIKKMIILIIMKEKIKIQKKNLI